MLLGKVTITQTKGKQKTGSQMFYFAPAVKVYAYAIHISASMTWINNLEAVIVTFANKPYLCVCVCVCVCVIFLFLKKLELLLVRTANINMSIKERKKKKKRQVSMT